MVKIVKFNTNYKKTYEIEKQLRKHLTERAILQKQQDDLWIIIKKGFNRTVEMNKIAKKIGENTYAIDKLVTQLIKIGCYSGTAHSMAINYLKAEIARNQKIACKWERTIRAVECGRMTLVSTNSRRTNDTRETREYLAKVKQKIAKLQLTLSKLLKRS